MQYKGRNAAIRNGSRFGFPSHTPDIGFPVVFFFITASTASCGSDELIAVPILRLPFHVCSETHNQIPSIRSTNLRIPESPDPPVSYFVGTVRPFSAKYFCLHLRDTELQLRKLQSQDPVRSSYHVPGYRCYRRCLLQSCKYRSHPHHPAT